MVLLFFQTNKVVAIRPAKITNLDAKMADAYPILGSAMVKMIAGIVPTKVIFVRKKRAPISRWEKYENLYGVIIKLKLLLFWQSWHTYLLTVYMWKFRTLHTPILEMWWWQWLLWQRWWKGLSSNYLFGNAVQVFEPQTVHPRILQMWRHSRLRWRVGRIRLSERCPQSMFRSAI